MKDFTIYGRGGHLGHVINFYFLVPESLHIKVQSRLLSGLWEKPVLIFIWKWPRAKVNNNLDLKYLHTFINSKLKKCLHLPPFRSQAAIVSDISTIYTFFNRKRLSYQIWPCSNVSHVKPRAIIWTNYDGLEPLMLQTKFRGDCFTCSREEDFWRVFTIYWRGSHLGHVTQMLQTALGHPTHRGSTQNLDMIGKAVSETDEDVWKL